MTEIFRPMLRWLMDRPTLVAWLFACIVGLGYLAATRMGREFMPELNEGSIMEMPTTVPRASVAEAAADLRARDVVLRSFPEVWQVVGKAGRAETATDPAPLDMIETIVNLRDRDLWPKRHLRFEDAARQASDVLAALEAAGIVEQSASPDDRAALVNDAAMAATSEVDRVLRDEANLRLEEFRPELALALAGELIDELIDRVDPGQVGRPPTASERGALAAELAGRYGDRITRAIEPGDVAAMTTEALNRLVALGVLGDAAAPGTTPLERAADSALSVLGRTPENLDARLADFLAGRQHRLVAERMESLNWALFDRGVAAATDGRPRR